MSFQAHERLEDSKLEAVSDNNLELVNEILEDITPLINVDENVAELVGILKEPHFQVNFPHHSSLKSPVFPKYSLVKLQFKVMFFKNYLRPHFVNENSNLGILVS